MKLSVQIPVYNEDLLLEQAIEGMRRNIPVEPFDETEIVLIDDGSTDNTQDVARQMGIKHLIGFKEHCGLAAAFKKGLEYSLNIGADAVVNIDADLQYRPEEIKFLVKPIFDEGADMVIGDRQLTKIAGYPAYKRISQKTGNFIISSLYRADIKDATSGFRAIRRDAAKFLISHMVNNYTYTIESICLLLNAGKRICFVPVHIRKPMRQSRLIKNKAYYVGNYLITAFSYFYKRS